MVTRFPFRKIPLAEGEQSLQDFSADRTALLTEGDVSFGKRISLRFRRDGSSALEE
jgi:hypothetical protein